MTAFTYNTVGEGQTQALAAALARSCCVGDCILLHGDLGAGKTAFARGFIRELLGESLCITSPTFTLVQAYPLPAGGVVSHFDLYRLRDTAELEEIGLEEALQNGITLIEWPELARDLLPPDALEITLRIGATPEERVIVFSGSPAVWQERLHTLEMV